MRTVLALLLLLASSPAVLAVRDGGPTCWPADDLGILGYPGDQTPLCDRVSSGRTVAFRAVGVSSMVVEDVDLCWTMTLDPGETKLVRFDLSGTDFWVTDGSGTSLCSGRPLSEWPGFGRLLWNLNGSGARELFIGPSS